MKTQGEAMRNPVRKNLWPFNKPKVETDKTKYKRKPKHKRKDHD